MQGNVLFGYQLTHTRTSLVDTYTALLCIRVYCTCM